MYSSAAALTVLGHYFPARVPSADGGLHYRVSWKFREIGSRNGLRGLFDIVRQIDSRVSFNDRVSAPLRSRWPLSASFSFDASRCVLVG